MICLLLNAKFLFQKAYLGTAMRSLSAQPILRITQPGLIISKSDF